MNRIIPNILLNCKRHLLVSAIMLLVLLSSCAVKTSIKSLVGFPAKTEQSIPKGNPNFSASTFQKCAQLMDVDTTSIQKNAFKISDLLPAVIYVAAFLFLTGFIAVKKENRHPLYDSSGKIQSTVPLFLAYRKLILHFSH